MLTRQLVLLLVGAVHFVAVRAAITKMSAPYMRIIKNLMFVVQSIEPLCTDLWSPDLAQKGAEVHQSMANVTLSPCPGQFWYPSTLICLRSCSESNFGTTD